MYKFKNGKYTMTKRQIEKIDAENHFESKSELKSNIYKYQQQLLFDYYDMGYVSSTADKCYVLSNPIKTYRGGHISKQQLEQFENDVVFVSDHTKSVKKACHKLEKHLNIRETIFGYIRQIYPDFCIDIKSKVKPSEFKIYNENAKKLRSMLFQNARYNVDVPSEEVLNRLRDRLSILIDSKPFLEACIVEKKFLLSEFETFFDLLSKASPDKKKAISETITIPPSTSSYTVYDLIKRLKLEVSANLSHDLKVLEMYEKLDSANEIKLTLEPHKKTDNKSEAR